MGDIEEQMYASRILREYFLLMKAYKPHELGDAYVLL